MVVLPELMRDVAPTFLYQGTEPVLILGVILASYLYNARQRWTSAALESGAIAAACLVPPLLLDQPSLYAVGLLMALFAVILATWTRRHTSRPLPWIAGGLAVYAVAILIIGGSVGPDLEREISAFRIMNWRDGLMGVAMVAMMILRPAGIIPERRKGITVSTADQTPALVPMTAAPQR
jgi:ABC-type branched-subunit amino acid transport system permease subunit